MGNLAHPPRRGIDGYPQRFGIPEGLFAEPVAVKQGWFCCWNGANQLHVSTGVIGPDRRYVMAIGSLDPADDAAARTTITQAVKTMFPGGRDLVVSRPIARGGGHGSLQRLLPSPCRDLGMVTR